MDAATYPQSKTACLMQAVFAIFISGLIILFRIRRIHFPAVAHRSVETGAESPAAAKTLKHKFMHSKTATGAAMMTPKVKFEAAVRTHPNNLIATDLIDFVLYVKCANTALAALRLMVTSLVMIHQIPSFRFYYILCR